MSEQAKDAGQEVVEMMYQEGSRVRKGITDLERKVESRDLRSLWGQSGNKGAGHTEG